MPDAKTAVTAGLFQRNAREIAVPLAGYRFTPRSPVPAGG
jgi:hypothetical protein